MTDRKKKRAKAKPKRLKTTRRFVRSVPEWNKLLGFTPYGKSPVEDVKDRITAAEFPPRPDHLQGIDKSVFDPDRRGPWPKPIAPSEMRAIDELHERAGFPITAESNLGFIRLDLGAGKVSPPGFIPMGRDHGSEIYPLPYADDTVDEIRASHVLEHFGHHQVAAVLKDWIRALKKGGRIRIAVPDFEKIAAGYLGGKEGLNPEHVVYGGQVDPHDYHKSMFTRAKLGKLLADENLVLIQDWTSELPDDCAAYEISTNLEGYKPHVDQLPTTAVMSVPRLGFMANMFCAMEATIACQVKLKSFGGAYWGQTLTKALEMTLEDDNPDVICTIDYDSIFTPKHLSTLLQLMMLYPEIDALAAIQSSRHLPTTLFTVKGKDGNEPRVLRKDLTGHTFPVSTAHFGLTLIRASKLRELPKPWFHSVPSEKGEWHDGDGHSDEDIEFWRRWERAGFSLHIANRVAIGHLEQMIRWPDINLETFYDSVTNFQKDGLPKGLWK